MRWSEYAAALSPDARERLVNALTVGCGHAAIAVRLLVRDAELVAVMEAVTTAYDSLVTARRLLNEHAAVEPGGPAGPAPAQCEPAAERWQSFVTTHSPEDAAHLLALLSETLRRARWAAEAVIADAEVEPIRLHLVAAAAALADARRLVVAPPVS